jgi:hypothetical protein
MDMYNSFKVVLISSLALGLSACSSLPGNKQEQGAVIGGASGAAVGAAVAKNNRGLGAIIGGAVGAAGGYVIGKNSDKIMGHDGEDARRAEENSQNNPATPAAARAATSADINHDGFVTLDEVVALKDGGLSDSQIIDRLRVTGQVFNLTEEQRRYLLDRGVSQNVIDQLPSLNQSIRDQAPAPSDRVISNPR